MGSSFAHTVTSGPMLLAIGAAALAGLVSFLSPCILPLVPGYLSYMTGLAGADLDATLGDRPRTTQPATGAPSAAPSGTSQPGASGTSADGPGVGRDRRGRMLAGTLLFVLGFTATYVSVAVLLSQFGHAVAAHQRAYELVVGILIVLLGLAFLGAVPGTQRQWRISRLPQAGLVGAPIFGAVFALSWAPCVGPTLTAVLALSTTTGQTSRAVLLATAYCLGLGLPFVAFGLGFRRLIGVVAVVRRHSRWVTAIGGALLILVGLALITGGWGEFVIWLQSRFGPGEVGL